MSDKDREAFEAEMHHIGQPLYKSGGNGQNPIEYGSEGAQAAWKGWQAARDHYAPKVTEKEAVEAIKKQVFRLDNVIKPNTDHGSRIVAESSIVALRAAGVQFKEES